MRHGEVHNPAGVVYGTLPGFGLSVRGREQAATAARHLRGVVEGTPRLVSSPLERAQQTATFIGDALDVALTTDERLIEARSFAMGLPRRFAPKAWLTRLLLDGDRPPTEDPRDVLARMVAAARGACDGHEDVILVSHQFPIWMARVGLEGRGPAFVAARAPWLLLRERCGLASITTIDLADPRPATTRYWEP